MKEIRQLLCEQQFLRGLGEEDVAHLAGCARNETFELGHTIFRAGEPADNFYIVRHGDVGLMLRSGAGPLTVQTLHDGDILGWSWIIPPYVWQFEARANTKTRVTTFDARCLRDKCQETPSLGYDLMTRLATELAQRLTQARLQLIDVYGDQAHGS